jgi:hypothetical protein
VNAGDWLRCDNGPERMLAYLRGKGSDRKQRLFAVACCRRLWHLLGDESRQAVETAEGYADGVRTPDELQADLRAATAAVKRFTGPAENEPPGHAAVAAMYAAEPAFYPAFVTMHAAHYAALALGGPEVQAQDRLLHDILGDERRGPAAAHQPWLGWQGGLIVALARGIYEERAFARLPILADALEEAGCPDEALLDHCHGPGAHVRGCWLVDWLLDKG